MTDIEKEARRMEILQQVAQDTRLKMLDRMAEDALLGGFTASKVTTARSPARTFVCQGCGLTAEVISGSSIKCGRCGTVSSAEVLP